LTSPNPNFWQPLLEPLRSATTSNAELLIADRLRGAKWTRHGRLVDGAAGDDSSLPRVAQLFLYRGLAASADVKRLDSIAHKGEGFCHRLGDWSSTLELVRTSGRSRRE
jgi:hypothetical protein